MIEGSEHNKPSSTVLLVEGDVLIRMPIAEYLRECGYRVMEAANVDEASAVLDAAELQIDVIFVSVDTGGSIGGFELARLARKKRPRIRTVLAGTPKRAANAAGDLCEEGPHLTKPYHPQVIERQIRSLLATRAGNAS
jgi:DNA-binding response OmpR family regulator